MKKVVIIDYDVGNQQSLKNALNKINVKFKISSNKEDIKNSDIIILPGVGSFNKSMLNIKKKKLYLPLIEAFNQKKKIIGICVGMQLFATKGFENGVSKGLNFIPGDVKIINPSKKYKLPVMNWFKINKEKKDVYRSSLKYFYFLHSYKFNLQNKKHLLYSYKLDDNLNIPAIIKYDNCVGIQFHPEKSSLDGLNLLNELINEK